MCACACHTHMPMHTYTHACTHTHTCTCIHIHACTQNTHAHAYIHMHTRTHTHTHTNGAHKQASPLLQLKNETVQNYFPLKNVKIFHTGEADYCPEKAEQGGQERHEEHLQLLLHQVLTSAAGPSALYSWSAFIVDQCWTGLFIVDQCWTGL